MTATDYAFQLQRKSLSSGTYTFVVDNEGRTTHALAVKGPGVARTETETIGPGEQNRLTVTLRCDARTSCGAPLAITAASAWFARSPRT
ncbi:MAG: hypothetical protein GEV07_30735 [Streptosporangiales bacterium]|nr:hypothetical protein [Streptosporangiales bacterium]